MEQELSVSKDAAVLKILSFFSLLRVTVCLLNLFQIPSRWSHE